MDLEDLRLFVEVAKLKSFAKASKETGVARSTLSRVVKRLESSAGVPLLHRTTRTVGLTSVGAELLERARPSLENLESIATDLLKQKGEPSGSLRVTTTPDLAVSLLRPVLLRLLEKHPRLRIETILTLRTVDLVEEKVDFALRVYQKNPTETGLTGRRLKNMTFSWYATPDYLERRGTPQTEDDLAGHEIVAIGPTHKHPRVLTNDPFFGLSMTKESAGIGLLSDELCADDIKQGNLVKILHQATVYYGKVWLLYPSGVISPAVAALRDELTDYVRMQNNLNLL